MSTPARLAEAKGETLLRAFAALTHRIHAARDRDSVLEGSLRDRRDLVQVEILRRMKEDLP